MPLIIGTKNKAKIEAIKSALQPLGLDVQGLPDQEFPEVEEDGQNVSENARGKAIFYSRAISQPVLSIDNALYFDGLAPDKQPGLNTRHIKGRANRLSDAEMLEYYLKLITDLGGRVAGYWEYGVCLAYPDGQNEVMDFKSPRLFVSPASPKMIPGYPLESVQIDPASGRYISEMSKIERDIFWQKTIGQELREFIKKSKLLNEK